MATQKNRLIETVLLSTQNICDKLWVRKKLLFYEENVCLSKPLILAGISVFVALRPKSTAMVMAG